MAYPVANTVLTLSFPIEFEGKEYKTLEFRRPTVRDNLIADKQNKDDADKEVALMSLLAGVEKDVILELDLADFIEGQKIILGFQKAN